jgi:hypothetical protein
VVAVLVERMVALEALVVQAAVVVKHQVELDCRVVLAFLGKVTLAAVRM